MKRLDFKRSERNKMFKDCYEMHLATVMLSMQHRMPGENIEGIKSQHALTATLIRQQFPT